MLMLDRADPSMAEASPFPLSDAIPPSSRGSTARAMRREGCPQPARDFQDRAGVCDKQSDGVKHSKGDQERGRGRGDGHGNGGMERSSAPRRGSSKYWPWLRSPAQSIALLPGNTLGKSCAVVIPWSTASPRCSPRRLRYTSFAGRPDSSDARALTGPRCPAHRPSAAQAV